MFEGVTYGNISDLGEYLCCHNWSGQIPQTKYLITGPTLPFFFAGAQSTTEGTGVYVCTVYMHMQLDTVCYVA